MAIKLGFGSPGFHIGSHLLAFADHLVKASPEVALGVPVQSSGFSSLDDASAISHLLGGEDGDQTFLTKTEREGSDFGMLTHETSLSRGPP